MALYNHLQAVKKTKNQKPHAGLKLDSLIHTCRVGKMDWQRVKGPSEAAAFPGGHASPFGFAWSREREEEKSGRFAA